MNEIVNGIFEAVKRGNWELHRACYHLLTFAEKKYLLEKYYILYPSQPPCYKLKIFIEFFSQLPYEEITVTELGCGNGKLGRELLARFDNIMSWVGYDLSGSRIKNSRRARGYTAIELKEPFTGPFGDVFVSSHTFEHMNAMEVRAVLSKVDSKYIMLEIPIKEDGQNWSQYGGAHILQQGREYIRKLLYNYKSEKEVVVGEAWSAFFRRCN